jgi:nitrile hydratase subunit beta
MNGPHDLGAMMGFGPVAPEANEPLFHAPWEKRALAISLAMGAARQWSIDASRHAREKIPRHQYWSLSYYEIWIEGLLRLMNERGLLDGPSKTLPRLAAGDVARVLAKGSAYNRQTAAPPLFKIGDRVRARNLQPLGHTRLPGYLRGKAGEIALYHKAHVFPDSNAHGLGENPQHLYTVRFSARDVFGTNTDDILQADLFEPYLEAA